MTMAFGTGELAALGTACIWAVSCQIHSQLSREMGATNLTLLRLPLAVALLGAACVFSGVSFDHPASVWWYFSLSGLTGVALCDWLFYGSTVLLGPRVACVCQSLAASMTAFLGVMFLGESLGWAGVLGIAVATVGVIIVVTDGGGRSDGLATTHGQRRKGIALALGSALALALAMFFSKKGFSTGADPLFCAFLRNVAAAVVFWPVVALMGGSRAAMQSLRSGRGVLPRMALGAVLGPGIGMWLSLVAVANTDTGVAATLIGLEPIAIMPVVWFMTGRRPTVRAVVGAAVAFAGTALLLMRHHL